MHAFSGPPRDLSSYPYVESLKAMINTFEQATRERGHSTLLFDNSDVSQLSKKDQETLKQLNEKLAEDPEVPLPEGFSKVRERVSECDYSIPDYMHSYLGQATVESVTVLDDLINELFGIHFLEPNVTFRESVKARFVMARPRNEPTSVPKRKTLKPIPERNTPDDEELLEND